MAVIVQVRSGVGSSNREASGNSGIAFIGMQIPQRKPVWKRIKRFVKGLIEHEHSTSRHTVL